MSELETLIVKRERIKRTLSRAKSFFRAIHIIKLEDAIKQITQLQLRLEKLEKCWLDFDEIQTEIEELDTSDTQLEERVVFETSYFQIYGDIFDFISLHQQRTSTTDIVTIPGTPSNENSTEPIVKLPPPNLPSFSGNISEWLPFYDKFVALVDKNVNLTDIEKLQYLKSCLKGEAANIISSVELVASNYTVALNLLLERYYNNSILVQRRIKDLFNLPKIHHESSNSLQQLLDNTVKNVRALKTLNQPVESWDAILIYLTTSKLDSETFRLWEETSSGNLATFDQLTSFLELRCRVLQGCKTSKPKQQSSATIALNTKYLQRSRTDLRQPNSFFTPCTMICCPMCKEGHFLYACRMFRASSVDERFNITKSAHLCFNCLRPNHAVYQCRSSTCRKCGKPHNTLLHKENTNETPMPSTSSTGSNENTELHAQNQMISYSVVNL